MNIGQTIKIARQNRNMTQHDLAENIVSRTSIVKIENGTQNPSFHTVEKILEKLGLSVTELFQSDPTSSEYMFNQILNDFKHLFNSTQSTEIDQLLYEIHLYQLKESNQIIDNIKVILQAFKKIDKTNIDILQKQVLPVWTYMEKIDNWSEIDIYIINFLLYFFETSTAEKLVTRVINRIDVTYPYLQTLKNSFLLNMSYLYLLEENTAYAHYYVLQSYELSKKLKRYDLMCINAIRMAIIKDDFQSIDNELKKLKSFNDTELIHGIEKEITIFTHNRK